MALLEDPKGIELVMGLGSCRRAAGIGFEGTHRSTNGSKTTEVSERGGGDSEAQVAAVFRSFT